MTVDTRLTSHMIIRWPAASVQHLVVVLGYPLMDVRVRQHPDRTTTLTTSDPELTHMQMIRRYRSGGADIRPGPSSRAAISLNHGLVPCYFRATSIYVVHHPFSFSMVQVQVWTQLDLLATMKIHNFVHIHLLLPYRVTEAYAPPHS
jgi:hypothetical protein